jgi:aminoglycoside phosphotransferase (APT) family kinase protein
MARSALSLAIGFRRAAPPQQESQEHRALAEAVASDVSDRLGRGYRLTDYRATRTGTLVIRLRGDESLVAKLSLRPANDPRLRHSATALDGLHACGWITPFLADRCPRILATGSVSNQYYSVETAVSGQDGLSLLNTKVSVLELIDSAEQFVLKLQKASLDDEGPGQEWQADFEAAAARVAQLAELAGQGRRYAELIAAIRARLGAQAVPSTYSHGNFWPGNILYGPDNGLTGVIDWDCATAASLPALDLLYFLIRTHSLVRGGSFGEAFADWVDAPSLPMLDGCLTRHCRELAIPLALIVPLAYCSWIQHLDAHCRFGTATSSQARWLQRNVRVVLDRWRPWADDSRFRARRWSERGWR